MQLYFMTACILAVAAVIEVRSTTPGLRPSYPPAERAFFYLGRGACLAWLALLAWGFWALHWTQPLAALMGSLAINAVVVHVGARPHWPGASMGLALLGFALTGLIAYGQLR